MTNKISHITISDVTYNVDGSDAAKILALYKNKSEAMRQLSATYSTSQIAKMLDVRYQFVNNVLREMVRSNKSKS